MNTQNSTTMVTLMALCSGLLFGVGLTVSDMINPARVLGFLDVAGSWDPTLAFVMGGALLITFPAFALVGKLHKPVCADKFQLPTNRIIDKPLLIGAVLFGIGWGLVGFCPGPALASLVTLRGDVVLFVASMVAGMALFQWWDKQ